MTEMKTRLTYFYLPFILLSAGLFYSCGDLLDVDPETSLTEEQFYRDKYDADAAVMGIYGQFLGLAERHIILNELRGDLLDVTVNADKDLVEVNNFDVSINNTYANPLPYYKVIGSCNDLLYNLNKMRERHKLSASDYAQRYADIESLRAWLYFQLAIQYGRIAYITAPLSTTESLNSLKIDSLSQLKEYPVYTLAETIDVLINVMENLPYKDAYTTSLNTTLDGYTTTKFFIHKNLFLADLYLWKGEYAQAASLYKNVLEEGGDTNLDYYRLRYRNHTNNQDFCVGYIRYQENDINSLMDSNDYGWRSMFARNQDDLFNWEWIWWLPYNASFSPKTPFVKLFANQGQGVRYQLKPSQESIDRWNSQTQQNGFPYDQRGRWSYEYVGGAPVVRKYLYNYDPLQPNAAYGKWFLYRAGLLHLRFAEATNRDVLSGQDWQKQNAIAYALLNNGIAATFVNPDAANITLQYRTLLNYPYNFDARELNSTPYGDFRDPWCRNTGVRGRAYLNANTYDSALYFDMTTKAVVDRDGLMKDMEDKLIAEAGLELAFEGHRWEDLLRIAIRRNDPAFLADKVYEKLQKADNPNASKVRAKLLAGDWFLPMKL